jgi:hypothetical protein
MKLNINECLHFALNSDFVKTDANVFSSDREEMNNAKWLLSGYRLCKDYTFRCYEKQPGFSSSDSLVGNFADSKLILRFRIMQRRTSGNRWNWIVFDEQTSTIHDIDYMLKFPEIFDTGRLSALLEISI